MRAAALCMAALSWLLTAENAQAYSDPALFAESALEAGGGGRFYTGSPADAYSCDSCHSGMEQPLVVLSGFPARYVFDAVYEVRVDWAAALGHAAASFELSDEQGAGAGTVMLPPASERRPSELCEPAEDGVLAASLREASDARMVVSAPDCGQTSIRAQWTAPARNVGPVWLSGAVLASNSDQSPAGDGVTRFNRRIPAFGASVPEQVLTTSCDAAQSGGRHAGGKAILVMIICVFCCLWRWRRSMLSFLGSIFVCACAVPSEQEELVRWQSGSAVEAWDAAVMADVAADDAGAITSVVSDQDAGAPDTPLDRPPGLLVRVTTLPQGGTYQPRNIGAMWIEDGDGRWLRTLAFWAGVRSRYLTAYRAANSTRNQVDAITSPTLAMHQAHEVIWNLRDAAGQTVPNGRYAIKIEVTDRSGPGQVATLAFDKTDAPSTVMPADEEFFEGMSLQLEP